MSRLALILAGHGSHVSPNTAGVVWSYVDQLRQLGVADEVTACFWKEPPSFSGVLDTVEAEEIVVVPLFTARGYFTQDVLPSEMGLTGALTLRRAQRIHLTSAIGEHPMLDAIVDDRLRALEEAPTNCPWRRQRSRSSGMARRAIATVAIPRGSKPIACAQAAASTKSWRSTWMTSRIFPAFIARRSQPNIIALPYFLAAGSHVNGDVPRALGISGARGVGTRQRTRRPLLRSSWR